MFAKVIVDIKHEQVNQAYDYHIPDTFDQIKKGMRVMVPFGAQIRMGIVVELMTTSFEDTKDILEVLDDEPIINDELFEIVDDLCFETHALKSEVFECVIPNALSMTYHKDVMIVDYDHVPYDLKVHFNKAGIWHLKSGDLTHLPLLKRLEKQGTLKIVQKTKQKANEKLETVYNYNESHQYNRMSQYPDFNLEITYTKSMLIDLGLTEGKIKTLMKHDVLKVSHQKVTRDIKHVFDLKDKKVNLTQEQLDASNQIKKAIHKEKVFLLHGRTGTGKTEVYLDVIEKVLNEDQSVLILVPEITLIGPMVQRLKSRFDAVGIYHSNLSNGEKYDQYEAIKHGDVNVVVATRSGIFLPVQDLGLIIIDESHDDSYKQTTGVLYDAVEIAKKRMKTHHIPLIMGSATPSVIQMYEASQGRYTYLELKHRPFDLKQPHIELVDMKVELEQKNTTIFSRTLSEKIKDRLAKKEQILLLYNRKGYAPFVLCRSCGDVPKCPDCDISLTYYKDKDILKCHYCGHEEKFNQTCHQCHQHTVKPVGVGIEYVEAQVNKHFPSARVLRMDQNVTSKKGAHEKIWHDFLNEKADILIGTQMIAKGLDFPKVTLVGVLMADLSLKVPSYNASETTYMLLTQMAGRSGRHSKGEVVIQGYQIDHYAILNVLKDYQSFYKEALYERKLLNYEPFMHVSQFLIEGENYLKTYQKAFTLKKMIQQKDYIVLGPSNALIKKIRDRYRFVVTLKYQSLDQVFVEELLELKEKDIWIKFYPNLDLV